MDDTDQLILGGNASVSFLARGDDVKPPYNYIEIEGRIEQIKIKQHTGTFIYPQRTAQVEDYLIICEWGASLL